MRFGFAFGGVWLVNPAVVLPAGGGFGALTIPVDGGAVEGVGSELNGTELVTGSVDAVGETLLGLPRTLLAGCGMTGGVEDGGVAFEVLVADAEIVPAAAGFAGAGCVPGGSGSSGSVSVMS